MRIGICDDNKQARHMVVEWLHSRTEIAERNLFELRTAGWQSESPTHQNRQKDNASVITKRNTLLHGYGLPNIIKTVEDKGGNAVVQYEDGMFILSIFFLL
jgi:hypothetical protein